MDLVEVLINNIGGIFGGINSLVVINSHIKTVIYEAISGDAPGTTNTSRNVREDF